MPKKTPLAHMREICLALPEAHEQVFGGHTNPTFRVRDKIFVMMSEDPEGKPAMWCKAPPGAQAVMVGSDPKRFFKPPYVGPKGWIGMRLNASTDWDLARDLALDSYRMTAPKRLVRLLDPA
jgi:predicted DNA-binding protein (MmcQ/YjbR family)